MTSSLCVTSFTRRNVLAIPHAAAWTHTGSTPFQGWVGSDCVKIPLFIFHSVEGYLCYLWVWTTVNKAVMNISNTPFWGYLGIHKEIGDVLVFKIQQLNVLSTTKETESKESIVALCCWLHPLVTQERGAFRASVWPFSMPCTLWLEYSRSQKGCHSSWYILLLSWASVAQN